MTETPKKRTLDFGPTPPGQEDSLNQTPPAQEMAGVQPVQDLSDYWADTSDGILDNAGEGVPPLQDVSDSSSDFSSDCSSDCILIEVGEDSQQVSKQDKLSVMENGIVDDEDLVVIDLTKEKTNSDGSSSITSDVMKKKPNSDATSSMTSDLTKEKPNSDATSSMTSESAYTGLTTTTIVSLTSHKIVSSFPALHRIGARKPYKCAKCCTFYPSEEALVQHVQDGVRGDLSCRRFFQKWRRYRKERKIKRRGYQTLPQYRRKSTRRNENDASSGCTNGVDDNIQEQTVRRAASKRKASGELVCPPAKRQFSNDLLEWVHQSNLMLEGNLYDPV